MTGFDNANTKSIAVFWFVLLNLWSLPQSLAIGEEPVRVFILAGQSNMEGKAKVELLQRQVELPENQTLMGHLHRQGEFITRDDVFIRFLDRQGPLTVGFGSPGRIGPELEFGIVMGDRFQEPVLLIKTAWGGKSLYRDFRPPSAGAPDPELFAEELKRVQGKRPEATEAELAAQYGHFYRLMIENIQETMAGIGEDVPALRDREFRIEGMVWFQGWNDMVNPDYTAAYTDNLCHFIRDVRRDLNCPDLPVVVGVLGVGGCGPQANVGENVQAFKNAQAAIASRPDCSARVSVVQTDQYWDWEADAVFKKGWKEHLEEWESVGSDYPYHYLGSAKCHIRMGHAFAEALLDVMDAATPQD